MKLINKTTHFVIAEIKSDQLIFNDPFLLKEMEEQGILIPYFLQGRFKKKRRIRLKDKEFKEAFIEIYARFVIDPKRFSWENH